MSLFNLVLDSVRFRKPNMDAMQSAQDFEGYITGVGPLTLIVTDFGPVPAQALRVRDRVRLRSGLFSPIARIDTLLLDESFLERHPGAQPVLIEPGQLGDSVPSDHMLLAPGQKLAGQEGVPQISRTAYDLCRDGVAGRHCEQFMTYVNFSFPGPEEVCCSGLWLRVEQAPIFEQ